MNANEPEKLLPPADRNKLVADFGIGSPHVSAVAFVILILSGFSAPGCGATVYDSEGSEASVQACIHSAADGDIVTVPAGTFSWTSRLEITKGITLKGQTTITGAGTSNPTVNDVTIIQDDTQRSGANVGAIKATMTPTQSFRLTGITFARGSTTVRATGSGFIRLECSGYNAPNTSIRIDHCHFDSLYQGVLIFATGWVYGIADHNMIEPYKNCFPFNIYHSTWGGANQINGNGSWADYPWYGTEKFFFIEDNTINITVPWGGGGQRSGTSFWHDNVFTGIESNNDHHCSLANYRETPARAYPIWGIADGTSPWDANDTEGNGTYV